MWGKNTVEPDRPPMTTWRMRIACWIPKATDTRSEYVTPIDFPLQQWLHESPSVLHYITLPVFFPPQYLLLWKHKCFTSMWQKQILPRCARRGEDRIPQSN